jgi:hypothetical protein
VESALAGLGSSCARNPADQEFESRFVAAIHLNGFRFPRIGFLRNRRPLLVDPGERGRPVR